MIAVSNSSPLVILAKLGCFGLLQKLFPRLVISSEVYQEVVVAGSGLPGAAEVVAATWIERAPLTDPQLLVAAHKKYPIGMGELSTILLAKELHADIALIDDHQARNLAKREGLSIVGTVGLLEALFQRGHLPDLRDIFRKLISENVYIDQQLLDRRLKSLGLPPL